VNGTDQFFTAAFIQFAAQRRNMGINGIGSGKGAVMPDVLQNGKPVEYPIPVHGHKLQQLKLFFGEADFFVFSANLEIIGINIDLVKA
jgi:hypothetical protein